MLSDKSSFLPVGSTILDTVRRAELPSIRSTLNNVSNGVKTMHFSF
jgi:hypothetical protein